ncbi:MAG: 30S ribosomal protein S4 [Candidatus Levybacteria bacterium]|nr:30S ribosomal protein S4 [Candidatus Levybacteria bacterium]
MENPFLGRKKMARYTGPKHRLARREGVNILDKTSATLQRRLNIPPGMHAGRKGKRRLSEFGQQLREKQKAKAMYGMLERQFRNLVRRVSKQKGDTGELLLGLLETRLDNVIYRLGFANSRYMARQLVSHGHIRVNDRKMSIPSYHVRVGEIVSLSDKQINNVQIAKLLKEEQHLLSFLKREGIAGTLLRMPKSQDVEVPFDTRQIIEYYSR